MSFDNPWKTLGVNKENIDKRALKKAYAALLKKNRPDEKPEEFQRIHTAYKRAMAIIGDAAQPSHSPEEGFQTPDGETKVPDSQIDETETIDDDLNANNASEVNTLIDDIMTSRLSPLDESGESSADVKLSQEQVRKNMQIARDELVHSVQLVLENIQHVNSMHQWHFFTDSQYLFEGPFNDEVGEDTFALISKFNSEQFASGSKNNHHIEPHILKHLNDLFGWDADRDYFYEQYGQQKASAVFDLLDYNSRNFNHSGTVKGAQVIHNASQFEINAIGKVFIMMTVALLLLLIVGYASF